MQAGTRVTDGANEGMSGSRKAPTLRPHTLPISERRVLEYDPVGKLKDSARFFTIDRQWLEIESTRAAGASIDLHRMSITGPRTCTFVITFCQSS
jgi:hypothetical protein